MADTNEVIGLVGENIYLRAVERDDLKLIHKWKNDPDIMRLDSFSPEHMISFDALEKQYDSVIKGKEAGRKVFAIVPNGEEVPVGIISFRDWHGKSQTVEVGLGIGEAEARGNGYGTEAMNILLKFLFEELNMHRVEVCVLAQNANAIKCFEKCGFVKEGRIREPVFFDGSFHDIIIMGILKNEFTK